MGLRFAEVSSRLAALAARGLGWRPHEFWAATPAELALALGVEEAKVPPTRAEILALIAKETDDAGSR